MIEYAGIKTFVVDKIFLIGMYPDSIQWKILPDCKSREYLKTNLMYLPVKKIPKALNIRALIFFSVFIIFSGQKSIAQTDTSVKDSYPSSNEKIDIAGKQYGRNSFHQWLWGKHYRKEWTTPVKVKMVNLDTARG